MNVSALAARIARAEGRLGSARLEEVDCNVWDWYAQSCPCGLPPGECRVHPRAALRSGHPRATGGSGRTSPAAARARPGPGPLGSSAGSSPAR